MQIIVYIFFYEVTNKLIHANTRQWIRIAVGIFFWSHRQRTELNLGLTFESWLYHINRNGSDQTVSNILKLHVFTIKFLDGTCNMLFKSTLMGTSLSGMLTIDK